MFGYPLFEGLASLTQIYPIKFLLFIFPSKPFHKFLISPPYLIPQTFQTLQTSLPISITNSSKNTLLSLYLMATNSLQSLHHHTSLLQRRHPTDCHPTTLSSNSLFLKPNNPAISLSSNPFPTTPFSLSSTTSTTPSTSQPTTTFDPLQTHLAAQNFRQADEETRRLLIALAGDAAVKRGYVFFSEVQFITESDLKTIDELWKQHSNNKFGYSVQKKIWNKVNRDFTKLFIKIGWMKKLDTEIEQYNYRAFPTEFIWELGDDSPEGHLPLTNALRGKQLLNCILNHPAFETIGEEEEGEENEFEGKGTLGGIFSNPLGKKSSELKTDYSF